MTIKQYVPVFVVGFILTPISLLTGGVGLFNVVSLFIAGLMFGLSDELKPEFIALVLLLSSAVVFFVSLPMAGLHGSTSGVFLGFQIGFAVVSFIGALLGRTKPIRSFFGIKG